MIPERSNLPAQWNWLPSSLALAVLWLSVWKLTALAPKPNTPPSAAETLNSQSPAPANSPAATDPQGEADVVLDAGHGGVDGGTRGNGLVEKDGTLEITKFVAAELKNRGVKVTMVRSKDQTVPKEARAKLSNQRARLAYISIHLNHGVSARGIETYFAEDRKEEVKLVSWQQVGVADKKPTKDQRSELLAKAVHGGAVKATGAVDRGVRRGDGFLVLNSTACPALLIECGFLSDVSEAAKLKNEVYQKKLALGIVEGLQAYLAKAKAEPHYGISLN